METLTTAFEASVRHHRITQKQKEKNDFTWYKEQADLLDSGAFQSTAGFGGIPEDRRMQSNYDLYNNIIDPAEFEYVCKPYGDAVGEMPAEFTNRDITSGKIKVLLGMEMKRPFSWKVVATNEEATTRKEQEEFGRIKEYVIGEIMSPIVAEIRARKMAETKGRQLTPEEQQQLQQQVDQEVKAATPEEVRRYMQREHQDPAEALSHQLLEYSVEKNNIRDIFNDGWKHGLLAGVEIYWEGESNEKPLIYTVNPLNFDYDKSPDLKYIEDGEWATAVYDMTPSKVVEFFGNELTDEEIDKIYDFSINATGLNSPDATFTFNERKVQSRNTVRVFHANFKSLRKVGFLDYINPQTGKSEMMLVDENYKLNKFAGDIGIDWLWIPEAHEVYKIGADIYKRMRPVPGQHNDLDNLWECKLSYKGACYDNMNSEITSLMDRMKVYQFYYNIIMYRIEMLMASDKGKILLMNLNLIPKSKGIDISKFLYYADASKIGFLNPNEEGNRGGQSDIVNSVKEVDLSLASDIQKYIALAEYIERRCGDSVGITKAMEGQTEAREAVQNNQLNYTQSSYIIEPYFELHNQVKRNVLNSHVETCKVVYSQPSYHNKKLNYVLDDMSLKMLTIDTTLLDNSTLGLFVSNSSKSWEMKQAVQQLAQGQMANQKAELSDIVKIMRSESIQETEELLAVAEEQAHQRQMELSAQAERFKSEEANREREFKREEWKHEEDIIVLKEVERRKTEIQKQTILSLGFNEDKDLDEDGTPDVLEVARDGVDANVKLRKQKLEEDKFEEDKRAAIVAEEQNDTKLKIESRKANKPNSSKK
jgi:hypothetical protein